MYIVGAHMMKGTVNAGISPLSPLVKSLVTDNEPAMICLRGRVSIMHRIESRFRFLAVHLLHMLIS
jgi:hypothetical protein